MIDISPWVGAQGDRGGSAARPDARAEVAARIDSACRESGFFAVVGHGLRASLLEELEEACRQFFALDEEVKARIAMPRGGRAWRGWFPLGGELTSGRPDHKEGIYFGRDLPTSDPRVAAGMPLHGPNLFPRDPASMRPLVGEAMRSLEELGQQIMAAIASALGLGSGYFREHLTADPVVLMRVFHYPADGTPPGGWGVGEHTDYGLLTLLHQDHTGGLEVHTPKGWVEVGPTTGSLVCNLGDMLERMTAGRYRATPHRVRPPTGDRISIPFFLDPSWDAQLAELPLPGSVRTAATPQTRRRWDDRDLTTLSGTYGDYLVSKVSRVFPALRYEAGL